MSYNYSINNFQRQNSGNARVSSPQRVSNYLSGGRYYQTEVEERSLYNIKLHNSELKNLYYEETRKHEELNKQLTYKENELESLSVKLKVKTEELDSFKVRYEQSEQIRIQQAKLIECMQKEIENIKNKLGLKDQAELEVQDLKSEVSSKAGSVKTKGNSAKNSNNAQATTNKSAK